MSADGMDRTQGLLSSLLGREIRYPSPMLVFTLVLISYFIVTAGVAYDIINEPPAIGAAPDPKTGKMKPQAFLPYRMNGQYIMEGMCGGMFYTLGGVGLVLLDTAQNPRSDPVIRQASRVVGFILIIISFMACSMFMRIKMPGYLHW